MHTEHARQRSDASRTPHEGAPLDPLEQALAALLDHLIDEEAALSRMAQALAEEQRALRHLDQGILRAALIEKKVVANAQKVLEQTRAMRMDQVITALPTSAQSRSLSAIIKAVEEPWCSQLSEIRHQIRRRLGEVQRMHEANKALATTGQKTVARALEHLGRRSGGTYGASGRRQPARPPRAVTVS
ncbi:MAG: flagellar protein FlgN [Bradymonadia bacterium]